MKSPSQAPKAAVLVYSSGIPAGELFSKKQLNDKTDLEEVKKNIAVLIKLYDRAIKEIENNENRKKLSEIRMILRNYFKNGNG